jgi:hypothetical protein
MRSRCASPTAQHVGGAPARVAVTRQLQRQHHVLQRREIAQQLEALENKPSLRARSAALVFVQCKQVLPGQAHRATGGCIQPGNDGKQVLLPEPEAPTMATVSRSARVKSISRKISSVPVESVTDLCTCATSMMGACDAVAARLGQGRQWFRT